MSGFKRYAVAAVLAAGVLYPRTASAMPIQMFDDMAVQDQRDYLKYLVNVAQMVLVEEKERDQVEKLQALFRKIPTGDHRSAGETQFEENLSGLRSFVTGHDRVPLTVTVTWTVEDALFVTLHENDVRTTAKFASTLRRVLRERPFWPKLPLRTK